jgi:serine/threonine protein kinase
MALAVGTEINGYRVEEELNVGNMATAFRATKEGRNVFFKQYRSPRPSVDWFRGYVDYQDELKRRINGSALKGFTVGLVDFFESTLPPRHSEFSRHYFQVFEWVEHGGDLERILDALRVDPRAHSWDQRLLWAKVFFGALRQLHEQKIVHADLKPANIQLIRDETIAAGYRLKLIDMDFSLLADRDAPWHGIEGYVGTPGYFSPEHLVAGGRPLPASDIFTAGLILYELLGDAHPYRDLPNEEYAAKVRAHAAAPPRLQGPTGRPDDLAALIHRMLSPDPAQRPTAAQVLELLNAPAPRAEAPAPARTETPRSVPALRPETAAPEAGHRPAPSPHDYPPLRLSALGESLPQQASYRLGQRELAVLGDDARYWDANCQCRLHPRRDGWYLLPTAGTTNATLLDGHPVYAPAKLEDGQKITVGDPVTRSATKAIVVHLR